MSTPLSNTQKREIAIAARQAYDAWPEREAYEAINSELSRSACFEAWRHVENGHATGIQRSTQMTQDHYAPALAHFQNLGGDAARAARTRARAKDNDQRIALYKLREALRERGLEEGYAAKICWQQNGCALQGASAKQLWRLVFTVRSRKKPLPKVPAGDDPF